MLISVVIPIYNVEDYIAECIESLLHQSYFDFEIILVDDGSQDSSGKICDAYAQKDSRVRVIHQKNGGVTIARLTGVSNALGEYICCVDGDDYVSKDYIEQIAHAIDQHHADIICCGMHVASSDGAVPKALPYRYGFYSKQDIENDIYPDLIHNSHAAYFSPNLWAKAIKKNIP